MTGDKFHGWPPTATKFFAGLEASNSKAYWLDHEEIYERDVKAPMVALLSELTDEFGPVHLFRPYRDIRFSKDKSPYKTSIAATVGSGYVQLTAHALQAGVGFHQLTSPQVDRYRAAVDSDATGAQLQRIVNRLRQSKLEVNGADELRGAPKGYLKDHPRIELLRYKGIVAGREWAIGPWLNTAAAKRKVVEVLRAGAPLIDWLNASVGRASET